MEISTKVTVKLDHDLIDEITRTTILSDVKELREAVEAREVNMMTRADLGDEKYQETLKYLRAAEVMAEYYCGFNWRKQLEELYD